MSRNWTCVGQVCSKIWRSAPAALRDESRTEPGVASPVGNSAGPRLANEPVELDGADLDRNGDSLGTVLNRLPIQA